MGTTVENQQVGPHFAGGTFQGYGITVHHVNAGVDEWSPCCNYPKLKAAVNAARDGTDAALDAAGADAFGSSWWSTYVVGAGRRASIRATLARYLPLDIPLP